MAELKFTFEFRVNRSTFKYGLCALLVGLCAPELASESVTLTTYYPAPSGIYSQMIVTGNAFLARDGGTVTVGNGVNAGITGNYALIPNYQSWAASGTGAGGAAIYNDANGYKKLMIVGNNSAGGNRVIGMWDDVVISNTLTVQAAETVATNLSVGGDIAANNGKSTAWTQVGMATNCSYVAHHYPTSTGGTVTGASLNGPAPVGPATPCAPGNYLTMQSGVLSKYVYLGPSQDPSVEALCCPCPASGCPSL